MAKTIIVVRHGESEKDKTNPYRRLTPKGRVQIAQTAKQILPLVEGASGIIVTTQTTRTIQTATILSKALKLKVKETQINLRVNNFDVIEAKYPDRDQLTFKYFEDYENKNLEDTVTSPVELAENFLKVIGKFEQEVVVLVGHGVALESFVLYQNIFKSQREITKELEYGEFVVLKEQTL